MKWLIFCLCLPALVVAQDIEIEQLVSNDCARSAADGDMVTVLYTGTYNGTTFAASEDYKVPYVFQLGMDQMIDGFEKGIIGMVPGDERRLTIPSELAYGEMGFEKKVPANASLTFVVMVLRIQDGMMHENLEEHHCEHRSEPGDWMEIKAKAMVVNGSQFDDGEEEYRILLGSNDTILGFNWGLVDMCPKDRRHLVVPPNMAYGEQGNANWGIPAGATLDYEVTLVSFRASFADVVKASLALTLISASIAMFW